VKLIPTSVVLGLALALLFAYAMVQGLNHDEEQFISAGWLLSTHGLLPYRDYPYFHMPLLVLIYGAIFSCTDYLLFSARTASVLWSWLSLLATFGLAMALFPGKPPARRRLLALGIVALLLVNPIFVYTYFRAWNQALPTLLVILAIICQWQGARMASRRWLLVSGSLVALAVSTRLSFAPLVLPFLVMAGLIPTNDRRLRIQMTTSFCGGLVVGFLPAAAIVAQDPVAFLFDNFAYNGPINAAYHGVSAHFGSAIREKVLFFVRLLFVQPANILLAATFLFVNWPMRKVGVSYFQRLIFAVLPFAWLGVLPATPSYGQYYYPITCLTALGVLAGLAQIQTQERRFRTGLRLLKVSLAVGAVTALFNYQTVVKIKDRTQWATLESHVEGAALRKASPVGLVLTLAPLAPLEGGMDIYAGFATGPFAWRTAYLLTPKQRKRYGFIGEGELERLLTDVPPASILTGREKRFDPPIVAYAQSHSYQKVKVYDGRTLWIRPVPPKPSTLAEMR